MDGFALQRHDAVAGCCWTPLATLLEPRAPPGGGWSAPAAADPGLAGLSAGCLMQAVVPGQAHCWMLWELLQEGLDYCLGLVAAALATAVAAAGEEDVGRGR